MDNIVNAMQNFVLMALTISVIANIFQRYDNKWTNFLLDDAIHKLHITEKRCANLDSQLIYWVKRADELSRNQRDDQISDPEELPDTHEEEDYT